MGVFQPRSGKLIQAAPPIDGEMVFRFRDDSDLPYLKRTDAKYLEIQAIVQEGVEKHKSPGKMIAALEKQWGYDAVDEETKAIIATESRKASQEAYYSGNLKIALEFPELKMKHVWDVHASGCCDLCTRLNGQQQPVGTTFRDEESGKQYLCPPIHLGCNCSLRAWRQGWDKFKGLEFT